MKLSSIDLNLFVVFEAIHTERNLTRAADILNVTQPAVSNALARLRAIFADPLFERRGGAMMPTPVAQSLVGPVRQALARLRTGLDQRTAFDPATSDRVFHMAMRDTSAATLLPVLARQLEEAAPHVHVQCHFVDRAEIPSELAAGTLDLAVDIPQLARSDLLSAPIFADRYVCVMRRGHPQAKKPMTFERFAGMRQIATSGRRRGRTLVEAAMARAGHGANMVLRLPTFQMAMDVVKASDLIATAPSLLARALDLVIKELPFEAPHVESLLYWHRNADSDPGSQWMRAQMLDVSAEYLKGAVSRGGRGRRT
ncbi:HTH-type transcriptional regulator LeuO [Alphaproteobacteria bacterium SO-S41]|nr:HTH-type transcriptional regulator LeuO [Alphaproteobacteria bacterium SO-S41]